jgi:hypothetical protein
MVTLQVGRLHGEKALEPACFSAAATFCGRKKRDQPAGCEEQNQMLCARKFDPSMNVVSETRAAVFVSASKAGATRFCGLGKIKR